MPLFGVTESQEPPAEVAVKGNSAPLVVKAIFEGSGATPPRM